MAAQANEFRRECALLGDLTHPNIIELKGICLSPLCMITSLEPLGDLAHYLGREETILSHWQCLWLASDVTAAVVYLQVGGVFRRVFAGSFNIFLCAEFDAAYFASRPQESQCVAA